MRSTIADAPLVVSTNGTAEPYITVTTQQLEPVVQVLQAQGIPFEVDDDAVVLDGRPALSITNLGHDPDADRTRGMGMYPAGAETLWERPIFPG